MTCRETLRELHPEWDDCKIDYILNNHCPDIVFNIGTPVDENGECWCGHDKCEQCWNREIPGTEHLTYEHTSEPIGKVTEIIEYENGITAKIIPTNSNNEKEKNMAKKTKAELEKELETIKESKAELEKELKNLDKYKQYEDMAGEVHAIYMAYVHAGFSEEQAYDLLKTMIENAGKITFNTAITPSYRGRK